MTPLFSRVTNVVFDLDDTLILERDYARSGFLAVGRWLRGRGGPDGFSDHAWRLFEEGTRGVIFDRTLAALGLPEDPELIAGMVRVYREHSPALALSDDARACLDLLRGRLGLAAISDGPLVSQQAKARAVELSRWLNPVIFTAALGPDAGKPSVRAFEMAERELGASGSECVYVADNPHKDFAGPKQLGWHTIRIRRPEGLHFTAGSSNDVDLELPNLTSLPALFRARA